MRRLKTLVERYLIPGGSVSFWHTPIAPVFYDYATLRDYPVDLVAKTAYAGPFDAAGVPVLDYRGEIGRRHNPCATAQYALGWFQRWQREAAPEARSRFFAMADALVRTQERDGPRGYWLYDFDLDAYGVRAPWISALAQAQAVSVLVRAARFSPDADARYLDAARAGYAGMVTPVEEGGLLRREGRDFWLEEVVAERRVAILDGAIFALFGVADFHHATGSAEAGALFRAGADTIARNLALFDLGYWSRADLYTTGLPMPASAFYHRLHIAQLEVLADMTGNRTFHDYADRWSGFQASRAKRSRALLAKVVFKLTHY